MPEISNRVISTTLKLTAFGNIIVGLGGLLQPDLNVQLFFGESLKLQGHFLRFHFIIWAIVLIFGLTYWFVAKHPERQSGLLLAAGLGKLVFAVVFFELWYHSLGTWLCLSVVSFDGVIGLLFLGYLTQLLLKPQISEES